MSVRTLITRWIAPLALATTVLPLGSCMKFDGLEETPQQLTVEVEDWRDEVIYQILVDRFANGDNGNDYRIQLNAPARYHGGDWQGIEDKLPYLEELGVQVEPVREAKLHREARA